MIKTHKYLALLRSINVGGKNIIKMTDLKKCFEKVGLSEVTTYIQSGNVIFSSELQSKNLILKTIENELSKSFNYNSKIVLLHQEEFDSVITEIPDGYGEEPHLYKYDIIFLKEPLSSHEAISQIKLREGVDHIYPGKNVIYLSRVIERAGQSYLNKIITLPIYQNMTIRNWNTTFKIFELMKSKS